MLDVFANKPADVRMLYGVLGLKDETDLKRFSREFARRAVHEMENAARQYRGTRLLANEELFAKYVEIRMWQGDVSFLKGAILDWQRWNGSAPRTPEGMVSALPSGTPSC